MGGYIIVYNKNNGLIYDILQSDQDLDVYFKYYPLDILESMSSIVFEGELPSFIHNFIIRNFELVELTLDERKELSLYKRILRDDERLLERLKPSRNEVETAKQTINTINLIQEVMI